MGIIFVIFIVAIVIAANTQFWVGAFFFVGATGLYIMSVNKALDKQFDQAKLIIETHTQELSIRRTQLTATLNYGLMDDKKWQNEIDQFIANIIVPQTGKIDFLGKNYSRVRMAIQEATANALLVRKPFSVDISPLEYERLVATTLSDCGWSSRVTVASGDQGIDVIAEIKEIKIVIQCKLYSNPVGNAAVQEAIAGKVFEKANFAAVVTNATFTRSARQLASASGVFLLHHEQLSGLESMCVGAGEAASVYRVVS